MFLIQYRVESQDKNAIVSLFDEEWRDIKFLNINRIYLARLWSQ